MEHPDWYPDWRRDSLNELKEKAARLQGEFELGRWPRFDYDIEAGTLIFSDDGVAKVIAEIQVVGTTSIVAGDWLWAWANSHWPSHRVTDSQRVREFGEANGIYELTHESVQDEDLNGLGWGLTAVAARITGALGAYRPPSERGALFLLCRTMSWAN